MQPNTSSAARPSRNKAQQADKNQQLWLRLGRAALYRRIAFCHLSAPPRLTGYTNKSAALDPNERLGCVGQVAQRVRLKV